MHTNEWIKSHTDPGHTDPAIVEARKRFVDARDACDVAHRRSCEAFQAILHGTAEEQEGNSAIYVALLKVERNRWWILKRRKKLYFKLSMKPDACSAHGWTTQAADVVPR